MNIKLFAVITLLITCPALIKCQDETSSGESDVASAAEVPEKSPDVEEPEKKMVNAEEPVVNSGEVVGEKSNEAEWIQEATEKLAEKPEAVDSGSDREELKIGEVKAKSDSESESQSKEEAKPKEESKIDVEYLDDDMKLPAAEKPELKLDSKDDNTESSVQETDSGKSQQVNNQEEKTLINEVDLHLKPMKIMAKDEPTIKDSNAQKTTVDVGPKSAQGNVKQTKIVDGEDTKSNPDEISHKGKVLVNDAKANTPTAPARVNPFFIIVPGIVIAFVVLLVVAMVLYQKTRSEPEPSPSSKPQIYKSVPTEEV